VAGESPSRQPPFDAGSINTLRVLLSLLEVLSCCFSNARGGPLNENSSPVPRMDGGGILMSYSPWRHHLRGPPLVPACLWLVWLQSPSWWCLVAPLLQKLSLLFDAPPPPPPPCWSSPRCARWLGVCVCWSFRLGFHVVVRYFLVSPRCLRLWELFLRSCITYFVLR
jgi:hypothetical protein